MLSRILRLLTERRTKIADTPSPDEPIDEYADPFGDMPLVVHSEDGDSMGWVHEERR